MTATIVSTLIGGLLALAGAFIGPFLQRKHDRWIAQRADAQLLREKAEAFFAELDKVIHQSHRSSVRILEKLQKKDLESVPVADLGPVRALATIYFPETIAEVDRFEQGLEQMMQELRPELEEAVKNVEPDTIQGLGVVMVLKQQQIANDMVRQIRDKMKNVTPPFEQA